MKWTIVSEGILVLEGTPMRIQYKLDKNGSFLLYQGDTLIRQCATLVFAKSEAEICYNELRDIGLG